MKMHERVHNRSLKLFMWGGEAETKKGDRKTGGKVFFIITVFTSCISLKCFYSFEKPPTFLGWKLLFLSSKAAMTGLMFLTSYHFDSNFSVSDFHVENPYDLIGPSE